MLRYAGWKGARLDILYMTARPGKLNPMDLTSNAGMAFLSYCVLTVWLRPPKTQHFKGSSTHSLKVLADLSFGLLRSSLRLGIAAILAASANTEGFVILG